jgi:molybdopterin/thiamine biosynthesis adenylyltransferase
MDIEVYVQQNGFENMSYFQISSANSQILKGIPLYHSSLSKFHAQEKTYTYRAGVLCVTEIYIHALPNFSEFCYNTAVLSDFVKIHTEIL